MLHHFWTLLFQHSIILIKIGLEFETVCKICLHYTCNIYRQKFTMRHDRYVFINIVQHMLLGATNFFFYEQPGGNRKVTSVNQLVSISVFHHFSSHTYTSQIHQCSNIEKYQFQYHSPNTMIVIYTQSIWIKVNTMIVYTQHIWIKQMQLGGKEKKNRIWNRIDTKYTIINETDHFFCYTTPQLSLTLAIHKEVNQPSGYSALIQRSNLAEIHKMTKLFSTNAHQQAALYVQRHMIYLERL